MHGAGYALEMLRQLLGVAIQRASEHLVLMWQSGEHAKTAFHSIQLAQIQSVLMMKQLPSKTYFFTRTME